MKNTLVSAVDLSGNEPVVDSSYNQILKRNCSEALSQNHGPRKEQLKLYYPTSV